MDPLSDIVALLRPTAAIAKPISGRGQWGVRYKPYDAPGFTVVLAGEAWVTVGDRNPLRIAEGDFLLCRRRRRSRYAANRVSHAFRLNLWLTLSATASKGSPVLWRWAEFLN